jgi:hypothetical protein
MALDTHIAVAVVERVDVEAAVAVAVTTAASSCEIASANRINVSCLISQRLVNDAFRYRA